MSQELGQGEQFVLDDYFSPDLDIKDVKTDSLLISEMPTFDEIGHGTPIRGKGRPKGEKNSRNPEKKNKTVLSEENRRKGHWSTEENKRYHWFL